MAGDRPGVADGPRGRDHRPTAADRGRPGGGDRRNGRPRTWRPTSSRCTAGSPCGRPCSCRSPPAAGCSACWPCCRRGDSPRYDDDDRALVEEIAGRAALALDNALLLADERATRRAAGPAAAGHRRAVRGDRRPPRWAPPPSPTSPACSATSAPSACTRSTSAGAALLPLALDGRRRRRHAPAGLRAAAVPARRGGGGPRAAAAVGGRRRGAGVGRAPSRMGRPPRRARDPAVSSPCPSSPAAAAVGVHRHRVPRAACGECAIERATLLALAEQCAQALDRARLYRAEHRVAETLQRSLLPQRLPQLPRLALAARYLPGAEGVQAGGDWYDVIELDEHRVAIAVGDVVGQGPAAAAVMGQLRSALSAALLQGHGPGRGAGAARPVRRTGARGARVDGGVPDARLGRGSGPLGARRAPAAAARRQRRGPPPRRRRARPRAGASPAGRRTPRASPASSPARRWSSTPTGWSSGAARSSTSGLDRLADAVRRHARRPPGRAGPRRCSTSLAEHRPAATTSPSSPPG